MGFLNTRFFNNSINDYLLFGAVFLILFLSIRFIGGFVFNRLGSINGRFKVYFNEALIKKSKRLIFPVLYAGAFYFALKQLYLNEALNKAVQSFFIIVFCVQAIRLLLNFITFLLDQTLFRKNDDPDLDISRSVLSLVHILIWTLGLVFLLNNLGFNVTTIIAGLGIGGIAVALAGQTILGDLFNYFVILLDKPFRDGDFIVTRDFMGTIENIGIKSTRLRSLGGEELVISNSNLTGSLIHNYKRMNSRRIEFTFTASHATTMEQLRGIPQAVEKIIRNTQGVQYDRAHLKAFAETGFVFEAVYIVMNADYNKYMDFQQKINFEIKDVFEKLGIDFARQYYFPKAS